MGSMSWGMAGGGSRSGGEAMLPSFPTVPPERALIHFTFRCPSESRRASAGSLSDRFGPEVVFVRMGDAHPDLVAGLQRLLAVDVDQPVDLRRIGTGAADGAIFVDFVDQHFEFLADLAFQACGADGLLVGHEAIPAILLDLVRHRLQAQLLGGCAFDR